MKQRNLPNILPGGFLEVLAPRRRGKKDGKRNCFLRAGAAQARPPARVPGARGRSVKHQQPEGPLDQLFVFLIIYLYLCLSVSLRSPGKLLGAAHRNFMHLYMLCAPSETLARLNIASNVGRSVG